MLDVRSEQWSTADAAAAAGVEIVTLTSWLNRGLFAPARGVRNPGSGVHRSYSACDIVRLAIMARLARTWFTSAIAAAMCQSLSLDEAYTGIGWLTKTAAKQNDLLLYVVFWRSGEEFDCQCKVGNCTFGMVGKGLPVSGEFVIDVTEPVYRVLRTLAAIE